MVDLTSLIVFLLVGLVAGFLAGMIMRGHSFGLVGNLIIGVIGAFIGGFVFRLLNIGGSDLLWQIISATVGAIILLFLLGLLRKNKVF